MPNYSTLVLTAADYKVVLLVPPAGSFAILTGESISMSTAREQETIYAVGEEEPIAEKQNASKHSGKLVLQAGEMAAILAALGYAESTRINNATLAVTGLGSVFNRTYSGVNINTENLDIKAKDKQSLITLDWNARSVK